MLESLELKMLLFDYYLKMVKCKVQFQQLESMDVFHLKNLLFLEQQCNINNSKKT
jgi:hypothetical protein